MVNKLWCLLDCTWEPTPEGFIIYAITDVPVHLWCVVSMHHPWYHPKTGIERGLATVVDTQICFVAPDYNEQLEAGDTLAHTFIKPAWPICTTKWFYFRGKVGEDVSPSNTCLFELHREPAPSSY